MSFRFLILFRAPAVGVLVLASTVLTPVVSANNLLAQVRDQAQAAQPELDVEARGDQDEESSSSPKAGAVPERGDLVDRTRDNRPDAGVLKPIAKAQALVSRTPPECPSSVLPDAHRRGDDRAFHAIPIAWPHGPPAIA